MALKPSKPQCIHIEPFRGDPEQGETFDAEFFVHLSHQLRTPLHSILSLSELMIARGPGKDPAQDSEYLKIIVRNGRDLLDLVNDILDLSRIEAEAMPVRCRAFSPGRTIRHTMETTRPLAEAKHLELNAHLSSLPEIYSDESKLRQILLNLLSNAIKFTERGSIDVTATASKEGLTITVSDSGVGIAPKNLKEIFGQYKQVAEVHAPVREGSGLGLSISRKLAGLLGGDLTVKSELGLGCCFTVRFPFQHQSAPEDHGKVAS